MAARVLEGQPVADAVLADVKARVAALARRGRGVGLGTILVGDDKASAGYVRKKHETCAGVGIVSHHIDVSAHAAQADLLAAVDRFNADPAVDAFLIQHPVPAGFDFNEAMLRMRPDKDGDGLHPVSLGKLVLQEPGPIPATPAGIRAILRHFELEIAGREVVIIGRGPTLGRPLSLLLTLKQPGGNAAVTVVHSAVPNLGDYARRADVLVACVGQPDIVTRDMVKPGAIVISGGITWQGRKLLPDVSESVGEVAGWITPRIGGVGVTTVAMLLQNATALAEARA
jgi:methylenetetrahydrofolate dehydrogenase (NADP+)/methenyltetrahydrofolate cyclohydrolase